MTSTISVIPPWKQALIEKKRKKEQEEKAKVQVHNDHYDAIPEWKKSLLAKKKGVQSHGADTSVAHGPDKPSLGNNTAVSGYDRLGQKRSSRGSNSLEHEHGSTFDKNGPSVIIIPKASLQNGTQGGIKQHSFVASSVSQSDQQRENKQLDEKLSDISQESSTNRRTVPESDENNSKVSYEHIRPPSELRRLFGIVSRGSASVSAESNEIQNQQTQSNKEVLNSYRAVSSPRDYEDSQKFSLNTHPQNFSREPKLKEKEVLILNHDSNLPKSLIPPKTEVTQENGVVILAKNDHDTHLERVKSKGINDEESPLEVHVDVIRTKFGPSGNFRLRSSSSDNLLKSKHQPAPTKSKDRPPMSKRWSADVDSILSSSKFSSDTEDILNTGHQSNLQRMRSISVGDVRVDHHFQDSEPVVHLRHRASISSDIERRLHELLLHSLLISDGKDDDDDDENDENAYFTSNVKGNFPDTLKNTDSSVGGQQAKEDIPKIRKASWYNPEDEATSKYQQSATFSEPSKSHNEGKTENVIHIEKIKWSEGYNISENKTVDKPASKLVESERNVEVICNDDNFTDHHESSWTVVMNGEISHKPTTEDLEKDEKPTKGSVYKLSSLFGQSISKGGKKSTSKAANDMSSKSLKEQQINQENLPDKKKKDSKGSNSSRKFPWSKKQKMSEPIEGVKEEQTCSLRSVQQKVIEQKITGNMTLVINSDVANYTSKSKQKQPQYNSQLSNFTNKTLDFNRTPVTNSKYISSQNSQVDFSSSNTKNQEKPSAVDKDDMLVTVIDVPDTNSTNDIEISAIDLPAPPSPTPVSVIDIPESPENDVKVSVIDIPDNDDEDSDDSDSSGSCMSGSYDINSGDGSSAITDSTEEEEEEDIDNVPVSYVGDSTYMKVPEVIFENKVDVKSCLSSPLRKQKRKAVVFNPKTLIEVHDYPSEQCMQFHYDQYSKENGKTLDQYRPSSMQSLEELLRLRQTEVAKDVENDSLTGTKQKVFTSSDIKALSDDAPKLTYLDHGEGFTSSSSSSGALLF